MAIEKEYDGSQLLNSQWAKDKWLPMERKYVRGIAAIVT